MDDRLKVLVQKIRAGTIGKKEAARELKVLKAATSHRSRFQQDARTILTDAAARMLGVDADEVHGDVSWTDLGMDTVSLAEYAKVLHGELHFDLNVQHFSEHPTIQKLSEYLTLQRKNVSENPNPQTTNSIETFQVPHSSVEPIREGTIDYLRNLVAKVSKLDSARIDADAPMEKYGINSIMVIQLTEELEKVFGRLSKTLFFEYQTLNELSSYFVASHRDVVDRIACVETTEAVSREAKPIQQSIARTREKKSRRRAEKGFSKGQPNNHRRSADIAVVGLAGRYPGASDLKQFWENLKEGKDCITEIPKERWDHGRFFDSDREAPGKVYGKWGGFIDGVDEFDPLFFNISPREAVKIDPQERLFLQCVYETLEDAGTTRETLQACRAESTGTLDRGGKVGVFVGVMYEEYQLLGAQETLLGRPVALSGNPSSIANRVSYFFNFSGPSMAVDTMCSSSLTAVHLACKSLIDGECSAAIAGGVNVSVHPNKYLGLSQGKFLSSKGRCESFGEGGDGYVPGEGVGAVLLKPFGQAVLDGDRIYGIIRGTAINHGGKTNGYSVPNPNAQAESIANVLEKAGIDPREVSYLEAHGTGTALGDPIEIASLTKAFESVAGGSGGNGQSYCAIGSVKSNIGHLESAAGIAGLTKVLLQMKYGHLAPSLHSAVLNPHIDFEETPFRVQRTLEPWKRSVAIIDGRKKERSRIAGVSAFGAGGSNAHLIVEEYIPREPERTHSSLREGESAIFPLSAKKPGQLRESAIRLLSNLKEDAFGHEDLIDIAYTLQTGREQMDIRLAIVASTIEELLETLEAYIRGDAVAGLYYGKTKKSDVESSAFANDDDIQTTVDAWIAKKKINRLAALWVEGASVDWKKLYGETYPRRIGLPTYPFAKQKYWAAEVYSGVLSDRSNASETIHPLLHENTSDLTGLHFKTVFTGNEFFLKDHVVNGKSVLPGVVYLEMVRAAVSRVAESTGVNPQGICLKNVVWTKPLIFTGGDVCVRVQLYPLSERQIDFEIRSQSNASADSVLHCQGRVEFDAMDATVRLDFGAIQARCRASVLSSSQLYASFHAMGIVYGASHQGVTAVFTNTQEVLAKLRLPDTVSDTLGRYVLHPSLMDAAFQSALAFDLTVADSDATKSAAFPFTLERLEILGSCSQDMWAWIRFSNERSTDRTNRRLSIDLMDENGIPIIRMEGFTTRRPSVEKGSEGLLLLESRWMDADIETTSANAREYVQHVITIDLDNAQCESIETYLENATIRRLKSSDVSVDARFTFFVAEIIEEIKRIVDQKRNENFLFQVVTPIHEEMASFSGLSGLLKTIQREYPHVITQLIHIDPENDGDDIANVIEVNRQIPSDEWIRYRDRRRQVNRFVEASAHSDELAIPWKDGGVYLITGGMGGLGYIFAEEIIRQTQKATIVLTGRSELDANKNARIETLRVSNAAVEYLRADISQKDSVERLLRSIVDTYGRLDGILHSAGVTHDGMMVGKSREEIERVLAPKVAGVVNLDEASRDLKLDFFVAFSSVAGAFGNPGQADYAAANAFMDAFAVERCGKTISINWPLWKEGGMQVDGHIERIVRQKTGMRPLRTKDGIQAFYRAMALGNERIVVLGGDVSRLKQTFLSPNGTEIDRASKNVENDALKENVFGGSTGEDFKKQMAERAGKILAIPSDDIEGDAEFFDYGFDSVTLTEFASELNRDYGFDLSPTLFFEHTTLNRVSEYLLAEYEERLVQETKESSSAIQLPTLDREGKISRDDSLSKSFWIGKRSFEKRPTADRDAIAIVGMSGRFPKAKDIQEFWKNLIEGRDCIEEIPLERWDWRAFSEDEANDGRTSVKWGGFIDGVDEFDPLFFGISPREAMRMDPQQRLLMTYVWKAIEDAGCAPRSLAGSNTGIFVATTGSGYRDLVSQSGEAIESYSATGSVPSIGPNRMSFLLDLHGPSEPIETACSSSLVAIHRAVSAIACGDCDAAIAGGVNILLCPETHVSFGKAGMLSVDGRCKTFSREANGYVRGEGVGMLFLKRLEDAEKAGDPIYAVIRGSAENHGGRAGSLTAPNPAAQIALLKKVYTQSGIDASTVGYIEAHGTGTELGDPIEMEALQRAFREMNDGGRQDTYCGVGSVKSNIGHLELAAGIAGVIKTVLQLKHKTLVESLHCDAINPYIKLEGSPFFIVRDKQDWRPLLDERGRELPRRAGVSSFGFGGVNAHVALEEYIPKLKIERTSTGNENPAIIVLSAKNETRLKEAAANLLVAIQTTPLTDADLHSMAYTLQVGRDAMEARLGFVAPSMKDAVSLLSRFLQEGNAAPGIFLGAVKHQQKPSAEHVQIVDESDTIARCLEEGDFAKLLELWRQGSNVDWDCLYHRSRPERMHLPTYPFVSDRYWIADTEIRKISGRFDLKEENYNEPTTGRLLEKTVHQLKVLFGETIQLNPAEIDADVPLEQYGIDSLMITHLNERLAQTFGNLSKTLFYEYPTLSALANFFIDAYQKECAGWVGEMATSSLAASTQTRVQPRIESRIAGRAKRSKTYSSYDEPLREPIAIIGMEGRYPQADDLQTFWANLAEGRDCITEIPPERWPLEGFYQSDPDKARAEGKSCAKWGGFLNGFADFDPLFFKISPLEAASMDPQERLFIETCWNLFEEAGYTRRQLREQFGGRVGVFVGVTQTGYGLYGPELWRQDRTFPRTSFGSIANRVSYLFDLSGPSMPIDTMCSSSLTAVHEACEHLFRGECEMAIAGGVNLYLHPMNFVGLSSQGMLSPDGKCRSFGEGANGFVPGEGVGAILLKPLSKAKKDGDRIHALILGTHINHDGKTNGYTVPNPIVQAELIARTLEKAGVDARTVQYIEAHGTGTELGDPIEITGLTHAFSRYTQDKQFCRIGSVKSNIGHLEAAAGIAGISKIVLQMQHGEIAPSLHAESPNPNIDFDGTPFTVVKSLMEWQRPAIDRDDEKREYPRIAGVSSFGAGGANAHAVLQEYIEEDLVTEAHVEQPAIVVLSARNRERLCERVRQLLAVIGDGGVPESRLWDMAYTLQVGREAMESRLATVVDSISSLQEKLRDFMEGKKGIADLYLSEADSVKVSFQSLSDDEDMAETIDRWIQKGQLGKFLNLWANGLPFDWQRLYKEDRPRRMGLPTYPFERERYWVSLSKAAPDNTRTRDAAPIHPLLHENRSTLTGQRFHSRFSGDEFFLSDHCVSGQRILPGVAYLEMARAAAKYSFDISTLEQKSIRLKDVVWARPLSVGDRPASIWFDLTIEEDDRVRYAIHEDTEGDEPLLLCQGIVDIKPLEAITTIQIDELKQRCGRQIISCDDLYEAFERLGVSYGQGYRGIESVFVGENEVLASLCLPTCEDQSFGHYELHPSIMDAATQAALALATQSGAAEDADSPPMPFSLDELNIYRPLSRTMWAWVRMEPSSFSHPEQIRLDIDLLDKSGAVCVRWTGLSVRGSERVAFAEKQLDEPLLIPVWDTFLPETDSSQLDASDEAIVAIGNRELCDSLKMRFPSACILDSDAEQTQEVFVKAISIRSDIQHVIWIAPICTNADIVLAQESGVLQVFRLIKAFLQCGYGNRELDWTIVTFNSTAIRDDDPIDPTQASVHGLVGSAAKEYPHWNVRIVDLCAREAEKDESALLAGILSLPCDMKGELIAYRGGEWYRRTLCTLDSQVEEKTPYREGGVYVVVGGAGGLGEAWSEWMIREYRARIVWIGRREMDGTIQAKIDRLMKFGSKPLYISADARKLESLQRAYERIIELYGIVQGVVHAAIVLQDRSLANMDEECFLEALSAKIDVSARIAEVFDGEELDFVLFFSSLQSFTTTPGQSNYAAGCTFKDAFARELNKVWPCPVKIMNWGYWGSVGAVASREYRDRMAKAGFGSIEPPEAMKALNTLWSNPIQQAAFVKTTRPDPFNDLRGDTRAIALPQTLSPILYPRESLQPLPTLSNDDAEIEGRIAGLLWVQLQSEGLFSEGGGSLQELIRQTGLISAYERWLGASLVFLEKHQFVAFDGMEWHENLIKPMDGKATWEAWERDKKRWTDDPASKAQIVFTEAALKALPEILSGRIAATDALFPNASLELVEGIYKNNPVADYFRNTMADCTAAVIESRLAQDANAELRLFEIGAGTGGTTANVLETIRPFQSRIREYCYTDLSKAFLNHGEKTFGAANSFLTFKAFDVEKPVDERVITFGEYDVVIAANVLHATRNIRQTLRNVKALLKSEGTLILNETSGNTLFAHLTFGLLEGWWLYEDRDVRVPGSPALSPANWQKVLSDEGFHSITYPTQAAHHLGQQIVLAESDGIIRLPMERIPLVQSKETSKEDTNKAVPSSLPTSDGELLPRAVARVKEIVGATLRIPFEQLEETKPLDAYGIDSILIVQLSNALGKVLPDITSTLFFEHQTIGELTNYLIETRRDAVLSLLGADDDNSAHSQPSKTIPMKASVIPGAKRRFFVSPTQKMRDGDAEKLERMDIAIIGLSGRYPKAETLDEFWENLREGRNCITEIPKDRWDWKTYYNEDKGRTDSIYTKWGGFIEGIDSFDPLFFQIAPREAERMDPQERLFLETAYACIEDAGYTPLGLCASRKVGVFVGVMNANYPTTSSYWSIANRVSYVLNFRGPSLAVDTACSSSLTAIHLACESIRNEGCECAIAGGVNLIVDPVHYVKLSAMKMLSSGERCRAFGDGADGFVDGEGVGAIVLKPLNLAISDGDAIYGVIKGSALNSGGKTNGYTVPNPLAQSEAISDALRRSGVHPRAISYLEAHGTGTTLGDPIEFSGLKRAFGAFSKDGQFCALGSVKSNVGHLEGAAGVAGLTKILLQMKHGELVPTLHCETVNHEIDFTGSPFVLQKERSTWKRPQIDLGNGLQEFPRIAGISSFGAGGANAHVVIEEYATKRENERIIEVDRSTPAIIVLSAKDENGLRERTRRLLEAVRENGLTDRDLSRMAFTLQTGREAMDVRLGTCVRSIQELCERLTEFLDGRMDRLFVSRFDNLAIAHAKSVTEEEIGDAVSAWLDELAEHPLLNLWIYGVSIDWNRLYVSGKPKRIGLPTYPFARERYWIAADKRNGESIKHLHPLVHENTSDIETLRFSTHFSGDEPFLTDHQINGVRIVPAAVYLEMARAAVCLANANRNHDESFIRLENVVWLRPLSVYDEGANVCIEIHSDESDEIVFEISSPVEESENVVHCRGRASLEITNELSDVGCLDIAGIQERCTQGALVSEVVYDAFQNVRIVYGKSHRLIDTIYRGEEYALAKLKSVDASIPESDGMLLNPAIVDAALQTCMGLSRGESENDRFVAMLPFALERLDIAGDISQTAWVVVRAEPHALDIQNEAKRQIDLCDSDGTVLVRLNGFVVRSTNGRPQQESVSTCERNESGSLDVDCGATNVLSVQDILVQAAAEIANVLPEEIDVHAEFCEHGLDAVSLNEMTERLNQSNQWNLTSELLQSYSTIHALASFLLADIPKPSSDEELGRSGRLKKRAIEHFKQLLSETIKLPPHRIDAKAPLEKYGIDSLMAMQMTEQLEKTFGPLSKTLFFEYRTIAALTEYFMKSYSKKVAAMVGGGERPEETKTTQNDSFPTKVSKKSPYRVQRKQDAWKTLSNCTEKKDIAIIGLAGRYPQADNLTEFWNNLMAGKDCITEIPPERWDHAPYYDAEEKHTGKTYAKWGGFLKDADCFDAMFFNISPGEAEIMDPQERLFLMCVHELLEDAGYTKKTLKNKCPDKAGGASVGVFAGAMYEEYQLYGAQETLAGNPMALSGNIASIANRVSYFFDFSGPSFSVDAMCSSSLLTLHLACESLKKGECNMAVAGGVNLSLHPNKYLILGQAKFASTDGRCKSFGLGGDGYTPGEGVGAVLLKPLSLAVADGDRIYGVVKGTAINHGGKTNGYTVPNPDAQAAVIESALENAGVKPDEVGYIEAHGTGTALGDPIEIASLTKAFQKHTDRTQYCVIGSVKSNVGHCESAAGIAGITKVLLQMKHGWLVPSIHSEELNPHIDFDRTPFIVRQKPERWNRPKIRDGGETFERPRVAGISSFGAGGANAHVILEEYIPSNREDFSSGDRFDLPATIVLSAKTDGRLKEMARRLIEYVRSERLTNEVLPHIAYTLQVGREAMDERMGFVVHNIGELENALLRFVEGDSTSVHRGSSNSQNDLASTLSHDDEFSQTIDSLIDKGKYEGLVAMWVQGLDIDWRKLYKKTTPQRISLPTYPFELERYWAPRKNVLRLDVTETWSANRLHPLVHVNVSDLYTQRFTSTFSGKEFFFTDHIVMGEKVLPGAVYLEMARASIELALGSRATELSNVCIENVVWLHPLKLTESPRTIRIVITPNDSAKLTFEISERSIDVESETCVFCRGTVRLNDLCDPPTVDLDAIEARCNRRTLSTEECYNAFSIAGIEYGSRFRGVERIAVGDEEILSRMVLPKEFNDDIEPFTLHPSLIDAALQSIIGLSGISKDGEISLQPAIPFALDALELYNECATRMCAFVRYVDEGSANQAKSENVYKYDIDLCDEGGNVCVRLVGLSTRIIKSLSPSESKTVAFALEPAWREAPLESNMTGPSFGDWRVLVFDMQHISLDAIETRINGVRCRSVDSSSSERGLRYRACASDLLIELQSILKNGSPENTLLQVVVPDTPEAPYLFGLSAMLKTARMENPRLTVQIIGVDPMERTDGVIEKLIGNEKSPTDLEIAYRGKARYVKCLDEIPLISKSLESPWRKGGVYLIAGGSGGLGLIFAKEIQRQCADTKIVLVGRSSIGEPKNVEIRTLTESNPNVVYKQVDIHDAKAVAESIVWISNDIGLLRGVIQSAGTIRDNFILRKSHEELDAVFAPKVEGTIALDWATREAPLDFFVCFSSGAGVTGNLGQVDYAAANAFMDAWAVHRNTLVKSGERKGYTVSIDWPLWEDGGMHLDSETEKNLLDRTGMKPMPTDIGIELFYQCLALKKAQIVTLFGDRERMLELLNVSRARVAIDENVSEITLDRTAVLHENSNHNRDKGIAYFRKLLSPILKLPEARIEAKIPLERYGVNSIMMMKLTDELEKSFGTLSKTLFFEHTTLIELVEYFIKVHGDAFARVLGTTVQSKELNVHQKFVSKEKIARSDVHDKSVSFRISHSAAIQERSERKKNTDIAIVSLVGRYPGAETLEEFWENLRTGKDCITEVPADRWDHSSIYDESEEFGKAKSKWGGFIWDVDRFDPLFFHISPRDAEIMDPKERLFLETVWSLLESVGYTASALEKKYDGKVGVYVGAMYQQYHAIRTDLSTSSLVALSSYHAIANRVSHFFNFQGPSMAIDTACSSSLAAIHSACESLKSGECRLAIAGGVNLNLHPKKYIGLSVSQMIGTHAGSRSFSDGDGYIPAEGVGAVLLKPFADAVTDGDRILAVVKSTTINHGGRSNGYSVPNPNAQANLIEENFRKSGLDPRTVTYVESAANGSALGDAIELTALKKAFRKFTSDISFCAIGSVKSNIGHAEAASGISQITKTILQMQHKQIAPTIAMESLNPNLSFEGAPFYLATELTEWKKPELEIDGVKKTFPRRATVSSFGAGGSNAHLILEEYEASASSAERDVESDTPYVMIFSAKNSERLHAYIQRILDFVVKEETLSLSDLAYTLQVGREPMESRMAVAIDRRDELIHILKAFLKNKCETSVYTGERFGTDATVVDLLKGSAAEAMVRVLLQEKNWDKLAQLWAKGCDVPWETLYANSHRRIVLLPTYPFERKRCWISVKDEECYSRSIANECFAHDPQEGISSDGEQSKEVDIHNFLTQFFVRELKLSEAEINPRRHFMEYGVDSITTMKLIRQIEKQYHVRIAIREMISNSTIESLNSLLVSKINLTQLEEKADTEETEENSTEEVRQSKKDACVEEYRDSRVLDALEKYASGSVSIETLLCVIDSTEEWRPDRVARRENQESSRDVRERRIIEPMNEFKNESDASGEKPMRSDRGLSR